MRSFRYPVSPWIEICAFPRERGVADGMSLSTVPGIVVLGFSDILAVFKLLSAILADFDMRGSAISALMLTGIAFNDFLLSFFMSSP